MTAAMDQRIADGLARGRVQFRAGKCTAAVATWKEALRVAYETQNQAAAFVLSKSLGDAALESSRQSPEGLHEAVGYYEYALQLLDACSLRDDHAFYPPLESVVHYIRRRRRRARRLLQELEAPLGETESVAATQQLQTLAPEVQEDVTASSEICSTCETTGSERNPIIVDEADGCFYCQSCYDDFYADATQELSHGEVEEGPSSTDPVLAEKMVYSVEDSSALSSRMETNEEEADRTDETIQVADPSEENDEAFANEDTTVESTETHLCSNANEDGSVLLHDTAGKGIGVGISSSHDVACPGGAETELMAPSRFTPSKLVYLIGELKALNHSNLPCPPTVKHSPVSISNVNVHVTNSRNQKQPSRKDKLANRPGKANPAAEVAVSAPTSTAFSSGLLPSLAECEAERATLDSLPSPLELAQAFFDGQGSTKASSFSTQLQAFFNTA